MSPALDSDLPAPRRPRRHSGRWAAIVLASLLAHLAALDLLPHWTVEPGDDRSGIEPIRARLMPPIAPAPPPTKTEPSPLPSETPARPVRKPQPPAFVPETLDPIPQVEVSPPSPTSENGQSAGRTVGAQAPTMVEPAPLAAPTAPPPPVATAPLSARLVYKVLYIDAKNANPVNYYGVGSIDWATGDGRYRSDLVAAVDFLLFKLNVLASHSEGSVTPAGLAPDRYTESPRKRATVATSFNRDARQNISYSATSDIAPLLPGTQDRLSILFQIGALLQANVERSAAASRIEIPVAGVRGDVESWTFESLGIESIEIGSGPVSTTHLRRAPRAGTSDRAIDVWIAQSDGGYPARVLYTEPNGSTIEMTLDRIGPIR